MNPIIQTLKDHNVNDQQIAEVFTALTDNPLTAMATIQSLGIPEETLKPLLMMVMTNPDLIKQAVAELNLDFSKVEAAQAKLQESQQ